MKIRMQRTMRGSLDGKQIEDLTAGQDYDTASTPAGDRQAAAMKKSGAALEVDLTTGEVIAPPEPTPEPEPDPREIRVARRRAKLK